MSGAELLLPLYAFMAWTRTTFFSSPFPRDFSVIYAFCYPLVFFYLLMKPLQQDYLQLCCLRIIMRLILLI